MKKVVINFEENSKIHIGEELSSYISSDRLYSIIINALANLSIDLDSLIKEINEKVLISSAFLGIKISSSKKEQNIDFVPKPFVLIKDESDEEDLIKNRKLYKNINWISRRCLDKLSKKYSSEDDYINYSFKNGKIIGSKYYIENDEVDCDYMRILENYTPLKNEVIQRNNIDRYSKKSVNTYYDSYTILVTKTCKEILVQPYFYFYIKDDDNILREEYIQAIQFISIGGKRSLGAGVIKDIEVEECDDFEKNTGCSYMNLSMVLPKKDEVDCLYKYSLEKRNGFVFSRRSTNIKKQSMRLVKEGSIFNKKISGSISSQKIKQIDHDVYIYGKAMLYPFGGDNDEK